MKPVWKIVPLQPDEKLRLQYLFTG